MCIGKVKTPDAPETPAAAAPAPQPTAQGVQPTDIAQSRLAAYGGLGSSLLKSLRIPLGGTGSN